MHSQQEMFERKSIPQGTEMRGVEAGMGREVLQWQEVLLNGLIVKARA